MRDIVFGLGLFLISLHSFYFGGMPLVAAVGMLVLVGYGILSLSLKKIIINASFYYLFCLVVLASFGVFFGVDAGFPRYLVLVFFLLSAVAVASALDLVSLKLSIGVVLFLQVVFFYIQFVAYYVFTAYFSVLPFFGLESRNMGGTFSLPWGIPLMRASGLYSEPGTYACFVAPLVAIYHKYADCKRSKILLYLSVLSLALSMSTFGLVFFFVVIAALGASVLVRWVMCLGGLAFVLPYFIWRFYERTQYGVSSGVDFRYEYIKAAAENFLSMQGFFFGNGGFAVNSFNFSTAGSDNDSGLIFYILYNFGALAFLFSCLMVFYAWWRLGKVSGVAAIILFSSKVSVFSMAFPVYLCIIYFCKQSRLFRNP